MTGYAGIIPLDSHAPPITQPLNTNTVITATARLAHELRAQFDRHQLSLGKTAWESADVLSWDNWLRRIWQNLGATPGATLLDETQVVAAWEDIIRADIHRRMRGDEPLWNIHATAKTAVGAWRILNAWRIDLEQCAQSPREDHQCMVRWARQFQQLCATNNWTDPYCLADRLRDRLRDQFGDGDYPPALFAGSIGFANVELVSIELAGFDHLLPQQHAFIETLQKSGVAIQIGAPDTPINQKVEFHRYPNEAIQWLSAARWAREKLLADPTARLAIIAPDLNKSATAIEYALHQLLCPQQLAEPGLSTDLPWHLSLGKNLGSYAVARAAMDALAPMAGGLLPMDSLCRLMRSPFIHGADREAVARAKLEAWCRRWLPWQIRFRQFLKELPDVDKPDAHGPHCPLLIEALNAALPLLEDSDKAQSAAHWAQHFGQWLDALGWPGERGLDSDEFQAGRAFRRQLRNLALLDLTGAPMNAATALGWLRRRVDEQPFQVQAGDTQVQVLSVVEAAGQQFDGIWFGELVEAHWPPAQRPNPFIALPLQRQAGVFDASLEANNEYAATQQQRLIASGTEVVLSYPQQVDEVATEPSALAAPFDNPQDVTAADFDTPAAFIHGSKPELLAFIDIHGPTCATGAVKGGISLIENQAKCPFRAFAIHRLGAREIEQNEQGLGAGERGTLIHHALQLVWQEINSSKELHELPPERLQEIVDNAVEQSARRYQVSSGCGERFHQTQIRWASATVAEWLEMEKQRPVAFVIGETETETTLDLNGLELTFKMDRIDQMENGGLALIDYKTGVPASLANWGGARPQSPQLPLYALARQTAVEAVAYGRVRRGDCGFNGVAREAEFAPKVHALQSSTLKNDFADWDELMAHWRAALSELAREFLDGEARVDPLNPSVCAQCDLHGLCRIGGDSKD